MCIVKTLYFNKEILPQKVKFSKVILFLVKKPNLENELLVAGEGGEKE